MVWSLAPTVNKLMNQFVEWYKINNNLVDNNVVDFLKGMGGALKVIWMAMKGINKVAKLGTDLYAWFKMPEITRAYTPRELAANKERAANANSQKTVTNNVNIKVTGTEANVIANKVKDKIEDYLGVTYGGGKI